MEERVLAVPIEIHKILVKMHGSTYDGMHILEFLLLREEVRLKKEMREMVEVKDEAR